MRNKIIFGSVIPAIRIFTGNNGIMNTLKAEDYPTVARVEFYQSSLEGTVISLQTELGIEVGAELVSNEYIKFEEYAHVIDKLPVMGALGDGPVFRIATTVRVDSVIIELKDHDRNEHLAHFEMK